MLFFLLLICFVVFIGIVLFLYGKIKFRNNKSIKMISDNETCSLHGAAAVYHDNSSKTVGTVIENAQKALSNVNDVEFDLTKFFKSLNK